MTQALAQEQYTTSRFAGIMTVMHGMGGLLIG